MLLIGAVPAFVSAASLAPIYICKTGIRQRGAVPTLASVRAFSWYAFSTRPFLRLLNAWRTWSDPCKTQILSYTDLAAAVTTKGPFSKAQLRYTLSSTCGR